MIRLPHIAWRRWAGWGGLAAGVLTLSLLVLDQLFPPPLERAQLVSTVVTDREGRPLRAFPIAEGRWRMGWSIEEIDPNFIDALIAIEDKRFHDHGGVDVLAAFRAVRDAVMTGRIDSGASTITMQTARLLEPRRRTIPSKLVECLRAIQIERRLSKDEILELYLTLTPYGGNLEGVRAASWAWFGRDPVELSPDQIALLIALPQSPEARRPDRSANRAANARNRILRKMAEAGLISSGRANDAGTEKLPTDRHAFPNMAWHAAEQIKAKQTSPEVISTLDFELQRATEAYVSKVAEHAGVGVQASALVIEIDSRAVRASVGSAGRHRAGGWIDLTRQPRSPGSTLKPFIYGLAFDDGIAMPGTRIDDLPARFATYRPENFDRSFRGEVTITQALQHSLNVPAVRVLDAVGANRFISALTFAGGSPQLPNSLSADVGLAVALGGLGLSVQDLGILYAGLGDGGEAKPLVWTLTEDEVTAPQSGHPILGAESASEILTILEGAPSPPGRMPANLTRNAPRIAYKTGTSYGFRDAWAAGVSGGYAIIVWVGRPDGTPRPGVTGREAALPALYDLFDLTAQHLPMYRTTPDQLTDTEQSSSTLSQFAPDSAPPTLLFPPDNADIWATSAEHSFVLSARGQSPLHWYADGSPLTRDAGGNPVWIPGAPGFYRISVVDAAGRSSAANVRVLMPH